MCDCVKAANKLLKTHGTAIDTTLVFTPEGKCESRLCVPTHRIDGKKRAQPLRVFATFCPLCGEKIPEKEGAAHGA